MNNPTNIHHFKIAINTAGQRIMIVDDDYRNFIYETVRFEAFDAIFFETEDSMLLKRQIGSITASRRDPNYTFKPFFFKPTITSKSALTFADGLCTTIDDPILIEETKRINERFRSLGFVLYDREPSFWTPENRMYHIVRTYLLRGDKFPEWEIKRDSSLGYAIPRFEILLKLKVISVADIWIYYEKACAHNLLKTTKLKAAVYCCPTCMENKNIWQELCPKCGTMDIDEVNMIHHFRCANISAEQTYIKDGKLICPKCTHELKHIGVDYDRPASMYYCKNDNIHFSVPDVKSLCLTCHTVSSVQELKRVKLYELDYTPMGVTTFAHYDHLQDSDDIAKLSTIYAYSGFVRSVRVRVVIARNNNLYPVVFKVRVTPEDNFNLIEDVVIHHIYRLHPNAVISYKNNTFYILQSLTHKMTDKDANEILPLGKFNKENPGYTFEGEYLELDVNDDIEHIIATL